MMKQFKILSLAALAVVMLGSCEKINQRIDALEDRLDGIETEKIASIDSQIASINSSIADLGTIRSNITSLRSQVDDHSTDIFNLEEADRALKDRILNLEDYLDDVLPTYAEKDWVKATFSTLAQYEATCDTIAKIDARIGKLDERLSKEIKACADSMKKWVNVQFEAYYTAAEMDAALEMMQADIDSAKAAGKITDERVDSLANELTKTKAAVDTAKANIRKEYRAAIDTAIKTSEGKLTKALQDEIAKVNADITALAVRVTNLEISVAALTGRVIALEKMIQTVTIVPAYSDGSVNVKKDTLFLDLSVTPKDAVSNLTKNNIKILLNKVQTKSVALDTILTDSIKFFKTYKENGTVSIKAHIKEILAGLGDKSLTVAVNVRNGISNITSGFATVKITEPACIAAGTMITMEHGEQVAVENLEVGDVIRTFDHETGEVSSAPVCFIWKTENAADVFTLSFEGDVEVTVIEEHGFYDREEQKYAFINPRNAKDYIGHHFYNADNGGWLELRSCAMQNGSVDAYAIVTSKHLNHTSNGMLSMCDGTIKALANLFEYDKQMKFDEDKMKAYIEAYGLTPLEKILELEGYNEKDFYDYNLQYLNIAIGKGLISWEWMEALSDYWVANGI